jgi:hypothetical protein
VPRRQQSIEIGAAGWSHAPSGRSRERLMICR